MSIIQNEYARGSVVFDCDYRTGSIADRSPYKAAATVTADAMWSRTKQGHSISFRGAGLISYADNAANKLSASDATFIVLGKFESQIASRLISKRNVAGTSYEFYVSATGLGIFNESNARSVTCSIVGKNMIAATLVNGGTPIGYVDGVTVGNFSGASTFPARVAPLLIGNLFNGTAPAKAPIHRVTILNRALSPAEISQLYQELISERYPLRAYSFGCRISAPKDPPGVSALLKTDFTTRLADGRLADLSGNGWHGTVKPGFAAGPGMCGNSLVATSASRTYVDFGDVTPINGASKLTVIWAGNTGTRSPTEIVFDKGSGAGARLDFDAHATTPIWYIGGKYCTISDANVGTPQCFALRYNGELDNANKAQIFRDGAPVTTTPQADMPSALPNTAGTPLVLGRLSWANSNPPPAKTDFFAIYNAALTPEQVGYVYRQIARRSTFALDMQRVPVSLANLVGPCEVPNTPFRLQSGGTWKVSEDSAGKRWFESVAGNNTSVYMPSTQAYGTWVGEVTHTAAGEYFWFISNKTSITDTSRTAYSLLLSGTTISLTQYKPSGQSTGLWSKTSAITAGNAYKLAITRTSQGVFTAYIKGGEYGSRWALVAVTSGANPVTNVDYATSSYLLCAVGTAASAGKFGNVRMFAGVLTLGQLQESCP